MNKTGRNIGPRHPRESGDPGCSCAKIKMGPRFRGDDAIKVIGEYDL
jgi:hypothetical protein